MGFPINTIKSETSPGRHLELLVVGGLAGLVLISPIFFGSAAIWARSALFVSAAVLLTIWLLRGVWTGHLHVARTWLWLGGLLCLGLLLFQLLPLSAKTLKFLSSQTDSIYQHTQISQTVQQTGKTLSVSPQASRDELYRLGIIAAVFAMGINTIRTRKRLIFVVLILLGLGTFQTLYAFWNQFAGDQARLSGTYHSKNHFAGLLPMLIPLSLAMVAGLGKSGQGRSEIKLLSSGWLSSSTFAQQLLVGAAGVLMGLGVLFSLSRAGVVGVLAGITAVGCYLFSKTSTRRYTVIVFVVTCLFVSSAAMIGLNKVMQGLRDAGSLEAMSWQGRLDLAKSSLTMIKDFPLWGTGLGTLPLVFGQYQSIHEGGWTAYSLHNDWLQLACENGLIVAGIVLATIVIFFGGIIRRLIGSKEGLCKLLSVGAFIGAGTMLLHSLADRNLSKITANGIVFGLLLAIAYCGAHLTHSSGKLRSRKSGYWHVKLGPWPIRVALLIGASLGLSKLCRAEVQAGRADLAFNRYLRAAPAYPKFCQSYPRKRLLRRDDYFWLEYSGPKNNAAWALAQLERAGQLQPDNPRYLREKAMWAIESIDRLVDEQAIATGEQLFAETLSQIDKTTYEQTIWALASAIRQDVYIAKKQDMIRACRLLSKAIQLAPSIPGYHMDLAFVLARLDKVSDSAADNPIDPTATPIKTALLQGQTALWLGPNKPAELFGIGCLALDRANSATDQQLREELLEEAAVNFRRAIFAGPEFRFLYPQRTYQLLAMSNLPQEYFFQVTPQTVFAVRELSRWFLRNGRWAAGLETLEILEDLLNSPASPVSLGSMASKAKPWGDAEDLAWHRRAGTPARYYVRSRASDFEASVRREIILGKCQALSELGRWPQRQIQVSRYQDFISLQTAQAVKRADGLAQTRRYSAALVEYRRLLRKNWTNPQALIGAAEMADLPGIPANLRRWNDPVTQLYRLAIHTPSLSKKEYQRAEKILDRRYPQQEVEQLEVAFVRGALRCLSGLYQEAVARLRPLAEEDSERKRTWGQEHLIWYFLAKAQAGLGQNAEAMDSFRQALEIVPTHLPSLKALQSMGDERAEAIIAELTPTKSCSIDFGGKVRLLGYTLRQLDETDAMQTTNSKNNGKWRISYFWEFQDRVPADCRAEVDFYDVRSQRLFSDKHAIRQKLWPYPLAKARWGEVVVEDRGLKGDPRKCDRIRFGFRIDQPPVGISEYLLNRLGEEKTSLACVTTKTAVAVDAPAAQEQKQGQHELAKTVDE